MKKFFLFFVTAIFLSFSALAQEELFIKTFDGKFFDLQEKIGKVVIVNIWASWCLDCRKEVLILDELYQEYKDQGLEIIGISIDKKRDRKNAMSVAHTLKYPNGMFVEASKISLEEPDAIPLNYIFDRNGNLVATLNGDGGELTKQDFEKIIKKLLKKE
ncbi:MAG: TlpA disulfide reductase family protein [Pseudomonadota bacterium]